MIQRHEPKTIEQELILARQQLAPDFQQLAQISPDDLSSSDSANSILAMIGKLSSPTIGINILRTDLFQIGFPFMEQFNLIIEKAESFYFQSIVQDLNRMSQNEALIQINVQNIKQCIEEINWKINAERGPILNSSQQVGENMDLMKFFEGVRNYQNWQDNIRKQCFERLKERSHEIQNQLTFKRGFILSKLQHLFNKIKKSNQGQIFSIASNNKKKQRIFNILNKFAITKEKDIFNLIRNTKKQPETDSILRNIFGKYVVRRLRTQLKKIDLFVRNKKQDLKILMNRIMVLKRNREFFLKYSTFKLLNTKPIIKASCFTKGLQITTNVCKRLALRIFIKAINIPTSIIFKLCDIANRRRLFQAFKLIKRNSYKMMKRRPVLSDKMKGKILVSLDKHQKVPMDTRKMFIKWYLNTHESEYAKKIYNIWLKGPTSKFTLFMRLKNMIKLVSNSIMSKQMKHFVKILCDRYAKYEQYNTKAIFIKWIERTRKIRKIESMFQLLSNIANGTQQAYKKISIENMISKCKRRQIVRRYCNKYLLTFTSNRVIALENWRKINNIKKQWGKKKLKVILFNIINQIKAKQKQVLNVFKDNRIQGRQKKISICNKAFNKDLIFLQRFYQTWRNNSLKLKETAKQSYQSTKNNKTGSILQIKSICSRVTTFNLRGIMNKFKQNKILREKRKANIKNSFIRIIEDNENINKRDIIQTFKEYWNLGKIKKEKLVRNFVHSNVVKEKVSFWIWKNKSFQMKELQKRVKSTKIFEILQEKVKDNYQIFNKKLFVSNVLQKIITNRTKNIQYTLDVWKAMPLRIRWNLRKKVIILHDKLMSLKNERLSKCHTVFKQSFIVAQMKMKKGVYIMACQFQNVVKKYFFMYKKNVEDNKQNKQIESVSKIFKTMNQIQKVNFKPIILAPAVWPQKLKHLQKLNVRVNKRLREYFESWQKSAQALQYLEKITNQKKKRCLQILNQTLIDYEANKAKDIIQRFRQYNNINQLQITFLKRLTESQGGKLIKGFMAWKNLPIPKNKQRIGKATKFESNLSRMVFRNLKKTFNIFKDNKYFGDDSKKYCINKLVAKTSNGVNRCFSKWRQNKRLILIFSKNRAVQRLFNTITDKNQKNFQKLFVGKEAKLKRKSLNLIQNFWNKQKKYYMKRWLKNVSQQKLKDITKKHMLINLSNIQDKFSKRFIVDKICSKFNSNRLTILKEKNRLRCERILHVVQTEVSHRHTILNSINDRMKFNHYRGIFIKNKGCHKFLDGKIKAVHNVLSLWNTLAMQAAQSAKQKIITNNFDNLNESMRANYRLIFSLSREQAIKKHALDKLFNVQQIKCKGYFNLWRQRLQQMKILGELDRHTKAAILERISKILDATSSQKVKETIKKFYMNSKIQKVQRKFLQRLMQTKGGKVIQAFKSWKSIPASKMTGKYKNYQKFYFKLQSFFVQRLKFVRKTFSETNEAGVELKKKSILKLFEMTSLGIRKFYNRWTRLTKQKHILLSVISTMRAFQSSQKAVQDIYPIVFKDKKTYQMKVKVIENLVAAIKQKSQNYLLIWRDNFREDKARRKIEDQKKKAALKNLVGVFMNSNYGQMSNIITLFQKNVKMVKISKTFFSRLMSTKTGKVIKFFQKLRTLPDAKLNKRKKKGIVFESRLHSFVHNRLRKVINTFKDNNFDAAAKKNFCLDKLARACMGQNQKKFLIWRNVVREGKILHHTSLFEKIFERMESTVQQNISILTKDSSRQIQKKKALCRKLMNNSLFSQHHAYMIWKEAYRVDGINITKKQNITQGHLKNLINIFNNSQNKNIVQTVGAFRRILELRHFEEYNFYKDYKNQKCLNFFDNLKRIHESNRASFINALKSNQSQSVLAQKSTKLLAVLHLLQNATKDNFSTMMRTQKKTSMVNKTFTRLFNNWKNNISRAFNIWRESKNQKKAILYNKSENKKTHLLLLSSLLNQNHKFKITESICQFYQNYKIRKIKRCLLIKILKTKSGKVQTAFNAWKMVPYQQARKSKNIASKFENNLARFLLNRLKQVTNCFKKSNFYGIIKKQNAVRNIVRSKIIESKDLFFKWRKINNENKITEKIISLDKVLSIANSAYQDNFSIFEDCKIQDHRKTQLATSLFNKNVTKLRDYFSVWRQSARSQKLHIFERYMRNFNPEDFNKRLMRIGFMMIQKRKDLQAMKGYINSLWKWKMSNIQATYYSKFIKVFKESEEMIKLSNLLNKKIYENQHHSFRSILQVGMDKTNRKREIVQKYLLRKARNYFMTFKNSSLKSQINVWKSKYTEIIKAKIWTDVLSTIFLKTEFMGFNLIRNYSEYTKRIQDFEAKLTRYQINNLRESFQKIKCEGHLKLIQKINLLSQNAQRDNIQQSFNLIKIVGKIQTLSKLIQQTMQKNVLQFGFNQIRKRKERIVKSRLSIILLETIISQDTITKIKDAIVQFKKNRLKVIAPEKIFKILKKRYDQYAKDLIQGGVNVVNITKIIERFKRAQTLKTILEKQDEQLKKAYLNKMRKKQNKWMELAIQKFATRASIKSSPAICLWRLKTYALNA